MATGFGTRLLAAERQRTALGLRQAGMTYDEIARRTGYSSPQAAARAVSTAIKNLPKSAGEELRTLQVERLNFMLVQVWPGVQRGERRDVETALRIMERLDKIQGMEAAQQINHTHDGAVLVVAGASQEYVEGLKAMAQQANPDFTDNSLETTAREIDGSNGTQHDELPALGMGEASIPQPTNQPTKKKVRTRGTNREAITPEVVQDLEVCERYVRPADPDAVHCARCHHLKADH